MRWQAVFNTAAVNLFIETGAAGRLLSDATCATDAKRAHLT